MFEVLKVAFKMIKQRKRKQNALVTIDEDMLELINMAFKMTKQCEA